MATKKYYTIRRGKKIGVFNSREECESYVKGYQGAQYKSFKTKELAERALEAPYYSKDAIDRVSSDVSIHISQDIPFVKNSIAVDAACSGNPGKMEYRGVDLENGGEIFKKSFAIGTNNIGEFLAIVKGLKYLKDNNSDKAIYTDSKIARSRVQKIKCPTSLKNTTPATSETYKAIEEAIRWLKNNKYNTQILKWETEDRGEIPADFGRK